MKTNKELNQEYDAKQAEKIRPKGIEYNFKPLEEVIANWVRTRNNEQN